MVKKHKPLGRELKPETLMMSYGYDPFLSEGAIKPPIFPVSTWAFASAEEGEKSFRQALGKSTDDPDTFGLVYSRFNHPCMEIFEKRLSLWERAEACAAFGSGMSAIFTLLFTFLKPGDVILHSEPLYGGTNGLIKKILADKLGVTSIGFTHTDTYADVMLKVSAHGSGNAGGGVALIFVETPANPTNTLFDLALCKKLADFFSGSRTEKTRLVVDNTYLGPLFQQPLAHGADMVVYSCTKYIGGHSDLIAGACLGNKVDIAAVRNMRGSIGDMLDPMTAWLLLRSLETLKIRMLWQAKTATEIARCLKCHKKVRNVRHLSLLRPLSAQREIYNKQCVGPGAMISFEVGGAKEDAHRFLNALQVIKLAVSLGSTESLAQHPASMTHAGVDPETRKEFGITDTMIRLSVGIEDADDLVWDLKRALEAV